MPPRARDRIKIGSGAWVASCEKSRNVGQTNSVLVPYCICILNFRILQKGLQLFHNGHNGRATKATPQQSQPSRTDTRTDHTTGTRSTSAQTRRLTPKHRRTSPSLLTHARASRRHSQSPNLTYSLFSSGAQSPNLRRWKHPHALSPLSLVVSHIFCVITLELVLLSRKSLRTLPPASLRDNARRPFICPPSTP